MHRLEKLLKQVSDDDSDNAVAAVEAIESEAETSWLPRLREALLHGEDFIVREAVARPFADLQGISALPDLLTAFELGVAERHDNDGLTAVILDLVEEHSGEALPMLVALSSSSNPTHRVHAAWLLDFIPDERALETLGVLLTDEHAEVFRTALRALASKENPAAAAMIRKLSWWTRWKYRSLIDGA